jgi:MFS family permease
MQSRFFYGWVIVMVAFVVDFIAVGFFFYSYGVFFLPIAEDLGDGSRFGVSWGIALVNIVAAVIAPWVGNALDRYPIKSIMAVGACISASGFLMLSFVQSMQQFYLVLISLTAVGTATMGQMATAKLVSNWFQAKRGTALGIATMGVSLSGMIMPPVTTWLITEFGWRGSLEIFSAGTLLIVLPLVLVFVVNTPEEKGLEPDGKAQLPADPNRTIKPVVKIRWREFLRMPHFWGVALTFSLLFCGMGATLTNMIPLARDLGFDGYQAAYALSAGAFTGVIGKVFFGVLSDRANVRLAVVSVIMTQWLGIALIISADHYATLVIASSIFGFGMGGVVPLHAMIVSTMFGPRQFGKVMGLMRPMMIPIQTIGLPLSGYIYDRFGSYDLAFYLFLIFLLIAIMTTWLMIPSERSK